MIGNGPEPSQLCATIRSASPPHGRPEKTKKVAPREEKRERGRGGSAFFVDRLIVRGEESERQNFGGAGELASEMEPDRDYVREGGERHYLYEWFVDWGPRRSSAFA